MFKLKDIKVGWIIHIFALLHAIVTLLCRHAGVNDELLLTVLTMAMVLLICMKRWMNIEFAAACVIMANVLGYFLGNAGADILQPLIGTTPAANALATTFTTEILGWTITLISRLFHVKAADNARLSISSPQMQWFFAAIGGIFILRIGIMFLFSSSPFMEKDIIDASRRVFSNSAALMTLIALNIIYIRIYSSRLKDRLGRFGKPAVLIAFITSVAFLETTLTGYLPFGNQESHPLTFLLLFTTYLIAEILVYCVVFIVNYAYNARREAKRALGMANIAEYRYLKLKHQVNPHFLFNSLNILDCLVCEEKTEQASTYIHKLAGIYRYMLHTEDEKLVSLREEYDFARQYVDLLHVRFPEGLSVNVEIDGNCFERYVVPCSLQLLIENATKHNAISHEHPLVISIRTENDSISVCNEIIPKVSKSPSTGLGLKYMQQQYLDLSGKSVVIKQTENSFCVTIPLL